VKEVMDNNGKGIPLSEIPGAEEAGIQWLMADGVHNRKDELKLSAIFIENIKKLKEELKKE